MKAHWHAGGLASAIMAAALGGCASISQEPNASAAGVSPSADQGAAPVAGGGPAKWQHLLFPGKTPTIFGYEREGGRDAVVATAASSASMLRRPVRVEPRELGGIHFSWKVPQLISGADMALRDSDDSPVRVVLVFEGDRSRFSSRDAMLSELMRTLTGEEMPYATLMYVWCNRRQPGTLITNPRTDRIRKLVVESGPANLGQWLDYRRDIRADFERAFGEPPGALVGVGIMSDTDNTRSTARAWYGPVQLEGTQTRAAR